MTAAIQQGDRVRIRKGAVIKSTHPQQSRRVAGRAYTVTVRMVFEPEKVCVGRRNYTSEDVVSYESFGYYDRYADERVAEVHNGISDPEKLKEHIVEGPHHTRPDGSHYCDLFIQVAPARVSWAGTGGYWCDAEVGQVEKI